MIQVWYLDISNCSLELFEKKLSELPLNMQEDVLRYRFSRDRKLKLFARMLVKAFEKEKKRAFTWENWKLTEKGKPYLQNGTPFSISHSSDIVVVAFSDQEVGVDVEKHARIDHKTFLKFFHYEENRLIDESSDKLNALYTVWTRKEAFLKAIGTGLLNEMNNTNCLRDTALFEGTTWYIRSEPFPSDYSLAVCSKEKGPISVKKLSPSFFE